MAEGRCCSQCPCRCNKRPQDNWPNNETAFVPEQVLASTPIGPTFPGRRAEQTNTFETTSNDGERSSPLNITWTELSLLRQRLLTLETKVKSIERKISARMAQSQLNAPTSATAGHSHLQSSRVVILSGLRNRVVKAVEKEFEATSTLLAQ